MEKSILQFHDGQMIRQRVVYTHLILSFVRDMERCGIDNVYTYDVAPSDVATHADSSAS